MGETLWCVETGKAGISVADLAAGVQLFKDLQSHKPALLGAVRRASGKPQ